MRITLAVPQTTLNAPITVQGEGVFTGRPCHLRVAPAPANHGLMFVATSTAGQQHRIPVSAASLVTFPNRSTLAAAEDPTCQINMVEHVLSALHGLGVDNALLTVEGTECPLGDGSALPFVEAIARDGLQTLAVPREAILVTESRTFTHGDAALTLGPPATQALEIDYTLDYAHPMIGRDQVIWRVDPAFYARQIGLARTFIPIEEAETLVRMGVLKSTDSECLVIYPDRTNHPLRIPHEFAAHKVLDCIGDLRLCGWPVLAAVTGVRSGHGLNHEAARWLAATQSEPPV